MTIEEKISYIQRVIPQFDRQVIYDTDSRGNDFCEMILQNPALPYFPITVTLTERGCSISVGQIENVTSSTTMSPEATCAAIRDILDGKIIFVIAYRDGDDTGFGAPYLTRIFALTGNDDDMQDEYDQFIKKISSPLSKFARKFSSLKGRFVIFNFTATVQKEISR